MLKPATPHSALAVVASLVAGSVMVALGPAGAGHAAVPSSHVEECAGLEHASSMTLLSSTSGRDSSGGHTSRARAWVYGVAGEDEICVVTKVVGAKVRNARGQSTDHSVGWAESTDGHVVLDTGEVLPIVGAMSGSGGSSRRTHLAADVMDLVATERISAEDITYLPPSLAGLAGHEATVTMTSLSVDLSAQAWTTRKLARPLTRAQRVRMRAAEIKVARARFAARVEEATAARDEQLALAAGETGLGAAWRTFLAETDFELDRWLARVSLRDSKRLARQHAAEAARGTLTREAYLHEITLTLPLG